MQSICVLIQSYLADIKQQGGRNNYLSIGTSYVNFTDILQNDFYFVNCRFDNCLSSQLYTYTSVIKHNIRSNRGFDLFKVFDP